MTGSALFEFDFQVELPSGAYPGEIARNMPNSSICLNFYS